MSKDLTNNSSEKPNLKSLETRSCPNLGEISTELQNQNTTHAPEVKTLDDVLQEEGNEPINLGTITLDDALHDAHEEEEPKSKSPRLPLLEMKKHAKSAMTGLETQQDHVSSATKLLRPSYSLNDPRKSTFKMDGRQSQKGKHTQISVFEIEGGNNRSFSVKPFPPIFKKYTALFCFVLLLVYYLAVLGLLIALLVVHLNSKRYFLESASGALQYIADNLDSDPILSIVMKNEECPAGFETLELTEWPGIPDGCYYLDDGMLLPALCDRNSDQTVYSFYKTKLYIWKGYEFCAQRATKEVDYLLASSCPTSFRQCSPGFCVKDQLSCPITNISLTSSPKSEEYANYSSVFLNIWRENDKPPLQALSVTVEKLPCFGSNENFVSVEPYIIFSNESRECSEFGYDESSFYLDNDTQKNFFLDNNMSNPLLNLSEYQSVLGNTTVILSGRNRIEVTPSDYCLNIDSGTLRNSAQKSTDFEEAVSALASVAFIIHIIIGLLLMNLFCGRLWFGFTLNELLWEKKFGYKVLFVFLLLLEIITALILAIYMNVYRFSLKSSTDYYEELVRENCFADDNQASIIITNYGDYIHSNVSVLLIYSLLVFVITGVYFLVVIYTIVRIARFSRKLRLNV